MQAPPTPRAVVVLALPVPDAGAAVVQRTVSQVRGRVRPGESALDAARRTGRLAWGSLVSVFDAWVQPVHGSGERYYLAEPRRLRDTKVGGQPAVVIDPAGAAGMLLSAPEVVMTAGEVNAAEVATTAGGVTGAGGVTAACEVTTANGVAAAQVATAGVGLWWCGNPAAIWTQEVGDTQATEPGVAVALLCGGGRFADGNVGGAVRQGPTVRRPMGPWTPAVHELLAFVAAQGVTGVPRVLGVDATGREVLTYLPGASIDVDDSVATDLALGEAAAWVGRYHRAVLNYRQGEWITWRFGSRAVRAGQVLCHGDAGAYNWVCRDGHMTGLIDWDIAGPGNPVDDLAYMAWNSLPLFDAMEPAAAGRRLELMAAAYADTCGPGINPPGATDILARVPGRLRDCARDIRAAQRGGDPGMLNLAAVGEPGRMLAGLAELEPRIAPIMDYLTAP